MLEAKQNKQKAQLPLEKADRTVYVRSTASDFQSRKKAISQRWHSSMHAMLTERCCLKLQLTLV